MSTSGWRQIMKGVEPTGMVDSSDGIELRLKQRDPALRDQLAERAVLDQQGKFQSYLDACSKAPLASAETKRKWRKALGL